LGVGAELGEGEAACATGHFVDAEAHSHSGVDLEEQRAQLLLGGVVTQVSDEDGGRNDTYSFRIGMARG
jgi:hypothetical protein